MVMGTSVTLAQA